jgi:hypothetical protein
MFIGPWGEDWRMRALEERGSCGSESYSTKEGLLRCAGINRTPDVLHQVRDARFPSFAIV